MVTDTILTFLGLFTWQISPCCKNTVCLKWTQLGLELGNSSMSMIWLLATGVGNQFFLFSRFSTWQPFQQESPPTCPSNFHKAIFANTLTNCWIRKTISNSRMSWTSNSYPTKSVRTRGMIQAFTASILIQFAADYKQLVTLHQVCLWDSLLSVNP